MLLYNTLVPQITKIKAQKNQKRVNLYLDGKFAFGLDADNFLKAGLKVGQPLSQKQVNDLIFKNEFQKLLDRTLRLIARRPHSDKEIRDYLKKKKTSLKIIEEIMKRLKKLNQVNDEEFTQWWVEQRVTFRPRGKFGLTMELRQKGIENNLIEKTVEKINELPLAEKVAQKKTKFLKNLPRKEAYQKLSAYLARRGFSWETIKIVVAKFLPEW
ncbi:MAG: RecX family transcriptional regulator [Candidatus Marinimicrobia bacterium]|nr:RecX family transcriptional regulator [Candidatus Neomarinimicrobiota bacterium]